ncbi:MAG TPA: DUF4129 domain-containing protein [Hanamia sp.]
MKSRSIPNLLSVFIFLCLLLHVHTNCYAQNDSAADSLNMVVAPPAQELDSLKTMEDASLEKMSVKGDSDKIIKWKHNREFSYIHYMDSLLRNQKDIRSDTVSFDDKTGRVNRHPPRKDNSYMNRLLNSLPFRIFFWLLALIFIGFISYYVLFKNGIFSRKRNKINPGETEDSPLELDEISQYDELIADAENVGNFNLAARYLFLKTLKFLSDRELIHFAPDKTNSEYLREMNSNNYYDEFKSLTRSYEYAWYGKVFVDANAYRNLKEQYQLFNKKV